MSPPVGNVERGGFFWADVLRFIAATLVVMEHCRDLMFLTLSELPALPVVWQLFYFLTGFGSEAVIVFFVLSGFWITSSVSRRIDRPDFWRTYLIDRLSRLLIVVVPVLAIGAALDLTTIHLLSSTYADGTSGALTVPQPIVESLGLLTLLGNLAFLQKLIVPTFGSNGPLWSLAYEFWYYIWFPSLLLLATRRRLSFGLLFLGLGFLSWSLVEGFAVWLMGAALFYLDRGRSNHGVSKVGPGIWLRWVGIGLSLVVLGAVLIASRLSIPFAGSALALGAAFSLFFWALLRCNPAILEVARPLAKFGSGSSFSLYAFHFPLVLALASILPPGERAAPDGLRLIMWAGLVLVAIGVAWLFSRLTEARTGSLRDWLRRVLPGASPEISAR